MKNKKNNIYNQKNFYNDPTPQQFFNSDLVLPPYLLNSVEVVQYRPQSYKNWVLILFILSYLLDRVSMHKVTQKEIQRGIIEIPSDATPIMIDSSEFGQRLPSGFVNGRPFFNSGINHPLITEDDKYNLFSRGLEENNEEYISRAFIYGLEIEISNKESKPKSTRITDIIESVVTVKKLQKARKYGDALAYIDSLAIDINETELFKMLQAICKLYVKKPYEGLIVLEGLVTRYSDNAYLIGQLASAYLFIMKYETAYYYVTEALRINSNDEFVKSLEPTVSFFIKKFYTVNPQKQRSHESLLVKPDFYRAPREKLDLVLPNNEGTFPFYVNLNLNSEKAKKYKELYVEILKVAEKKDFLQVIKLCNRLLSDIKNLEEDPAQYYAFSNIYFQMGLAKRKLQELNVKHDYNDSDHLDDLKIAAGLSEDFLFFSEYGVSLLYEQHYPLAFKVMTNMFYAYLKSEITVNDEPEGYHLNEINNRFINGINTLAENNKVNLQYDQKLNELYQLIKKYVYNFHHSNKENKAGELLNTLNLLWKNNGVSYNIFYPDKEQQELLELNQLIYPNEKYYIHAIILLILMYIGRLGAKIIKPYIQTAIEKKRKRYLVNLKQELSECLESFSHTLRTEKDELKLELKNGNFETIIDGKKEKISFTAAELLTIIKDKIAGKSFQVKNDNTLIFNGQSKVHFSAHFNEEIKKDLAAAWIRKKDEESKRKLSADLIKFKSDFHVKFNNLDNEKTFLQIALENLSKKNKDIFTIDKDSFLKDAVVAPIYKQHEGPLTKKFKEYQSYITTYKNTLETEIENVTKSRTELSKLRILTEIENVSAEQVHNLKVSLEYTQFIKKIDNTVTDTKSLRQKCEEKLNELEKAYNEERELFLAAIEQAKPKNANTKTTTTTTTTTSSVLISTQQNNNNHSSNPIDAPSAPKSSTNEKSKPTEELNKNSNLPGLSLFSNPLQEISLVNNPVISTSDNKNNFISLELNDLPQHIQQIIGPQRQLEQILSNQEVKICVWKKNGNKFEMIRSNNVSDTEQTINIQTEDGQTIASYLQELSVIPSEKYNPTLKKPENVYLNTSTTSTIPSRFYSNNNNNNSTATYTPKLRKLTEKEFVSYIAEQTHHIAGYYAKFNKTEDNMTKMMYINASYFRLLRFLCIAVNFKKDIFSNYNIINPIIHGYHLNNEDMNTVFDQINEMNLIIATDFAKKLIENSSLKKTDNQEIDILEFFKANSAEDTTKIISMLNFENADMIRIAKSLFFSERTHTALDHENGFEAIRQRCAELKAVLSLEINSDTDDWYQAARDDAIKMKIVIIGEIWARVCENLLPVEDKKNYTISKETLTKMQTGIQDAFNLPISVIEQLQKVVLFRNSMVHKPNNLLNDFDTFAFANQCVEILEHLNPITPSPTISTNR